MFNDERITIESGKIFRKANILAIIIAIVFLSVRCFLYSNPNSNYVLTFGILSTEICTIISALIILIYGELKYRTDVNDERSVSTKYEYYSKTGKILLISIIVGYAISMIDSFKRSPSDFAPNYIIFVFQALGAVYFYYTFKKKQININYTFINNDKKTYYYHVLKLIGYLALIIFGVYILCGFVSMIIYQSLEYILVFLFAAFSSAIGLGIQYLFISFLEKLDYDDEEDHIKISLFISGIVVAITYLILAISSGTIVYIANNGLVSKLGDFIAYATNLRNNIEFITIFYQGVSLSYLLSYSLKNKKVCNGITLFCIMLFITTIFSVVSHLPFYLIMQNEITVAKYYVAQSWTNKIFAFSYIIIFTLIVISVIKEKRFGKKLILIPMVEIIVFFVCLFLSTQGDTEKFIMSILDPLSKAVCYLLFYLLLYKIDNKKQNNNLLIE